MNLLVAAVLLGILEGLTEFIPVSSTGHLILAGHALDFVGQRAETFEIFIQLGAILAVVVLYHRRFLALIPGKGTGAGLSGFAGLGKLGAACLPAFLAGFLLHDFIKEHLFSTYTVALALILGGVVMIIVERLERRVSVRSVEELSFGRCLGIGLFQCFSLWPGMSRSASTIVGGLLLGTERKVAAEFSFLVAVPVMFVAVGYDLLKSVTFLRAEDFLLFGVGFAVSFVVAMAAIKGFLALLHRFTLAPFGWYRIALGALVLALAGMAHS